MIPKRDHGGGLDAAVAQFGGVRANWIDLSTGINPVPYPVPAISADAWSALPDQGAMERMLIAARRLWHVPEGCDILAANGASALIAQLPTLAPAAQVHIPSPTYNEHAAAFATHGWQETNGTAQAKVIVNPNNPTGDWYESKDLTARLMIIDESFGDVAPERSLVAHAAEPGTIVLKSFGKFWGLAGLRLGFAIARPDTIDVLRANLGPWPVSGPALQIATAALSDADWANQTRVRLNSDANRLDQMMTHAGAQCAGGTSLFRLYRVHNAQDWQNRLASHHIWTRIFPYSDTLLRLGLPVGPDDWDRLGSAL